MARVLTIMGSGETAPTMIKTHRRVMEMVGATDPGDAVLLGAERGQHRAVLVLACEVQIRIDLVHR